MTSEVQNDVFYPQRKSVSKQMVERFERRKTWRRGVAVFYLLAYAFYLCWRYTIINPDSLFLSWVFYTAECIGFCLSVITCASIWEYSHREPPPSPQGLTVDVLVPIYKAPLGIARRTVMAARDIDYPHKTFLLDDGKRDDLKQLAEELGVIYLRRSDNKFAKAGNLNAALPYSNAEFVMTFDEDHIALPHALDLMLGFFADADVAMVQTPQDYYNTDAFPYMNSKSNGALWHEQSAFYNIVEPCADAFNSSTCVGTGVVYRRVALDRIGGFPVETITEDLHTSIRFHKCGYKTVFLNEPIAYGLAAVDLDEYYKTRHRWTHGNIHAVCLENAPFSKKLTWRQRWHYLSIELVFLEGLQQLLLFPVPVLALFFGLQPFDITLFNVIVMLIFPFFSYVMMQEIGCGFSRFWVNEVFSMVRWPIYLASFSGAFGKKMAWISSSKSMSGKVNWRLMLPQFAVMAVSLASVLFAIVKLGGHYQTGPLFHTIGSMISGHGIPKDTNFNVRLQGGHTADLVIIAGMWAMYTVFRVLFVAKKVIYDARNSHDVFRFDIPLPVRLNGGDNTLGCISSISEKWCALFFDGAPPQIAVGENLTMTIFMPAGPMPVTLRMSAVNGASVEGDFVWDQPSSSDPLTNGLYSVDWHREFRSRAGYFMTPSDLILGLFGVKSSMRGLYNNWGACLFKNDAYGVLGLGLDDRQTGSFICFKKLEIGEVIEIIYFHNKISRQIKLRIIEPQMLSSLTPRGLDGAVTYKYRVGIVI